MISIGGYIMLMPFVACGLCCNRKGKDGYKKTKSKESSAA